MLIKCHEYETNYDILFNTDEMMYVDTNSKSNKIVSLIGTYNSINNLYTNETPEKIYNMILNTGNFIRLHNANDNSTIIINKAIIDHAIVGSDKYQNKTEIFPTKESGLSGFFVNESIDKLLEIINSLNK